MKHMSLDGHSVEKDSVIVVMVVVVVVLALGRGEVGKETKKKLSIQNEDSPSQIDTERAERHMEQVINGIQGSLGGR